jgi:hypothetical protein
MEPLRGCPSLELRVALHLTLTLLIGRSVKKTYLQSLQEIETYADTGLAFHFLFAIQRSLLQYAALSAVELYSDTIRDDDAVDINDLLRRVHSPTDATPIDLLDILIPVIRQGGWSSFCLGWYERLPEYEQAAFQDPLVRMLSRWLTIRNDRPGHGVVDEHTVLTQRKWLTDLIRHSLFVLDSALPKYRADDDGGHLLISAPAGDFRLKCLHTQNGTPIIVRRIASRHGRWRVQYQTLDIRRSVEGEYELEANSPLVSFSPSLATRYTSFHVALKDRDWRPWCCFLIVRPVSLKAGSRSSLTCLSGSTTRIHVRV